MNVSCHHLSLPTLVSLLNNHYLYLFSLETADVHLQTSLLWIQFAFYIFFQFQFKSLSTSVIWNSI